LSANGFRVVKHGYTAPNAKYRFGEVWYAVEERIIWQDSG
jgi:hypothetical protein